MTARPLPSNRRPLSRVVKAALTLEVLLALGALGGGLVLIVAPRGEIMPLPLSALAGSPFDTYLGPGLILFTVLGIGPLLAARLAWGRHWLAPFAALVVGVALLIWVVVEISIIGYSDEPPLQAIYLVMGVVITVVALGWLAQTGLPLRQRLHGCRPALAASAGQEVEASKRVAGWNGRTIRPVVRSAPRRPP